MGVHKQGIHRTNNKTDEGNEGVFDGLIDDDAHFELFDFWIIRLLDYLTFLILSIHLF
ncbi:MAG: hypothetical protein Q8K02_00160 [Flavobacterium sp.]|nr:hypothetical protein [Flavobacterium sp.]